MEETTTTTVSTRSVGLTFGLISAVIGIAIFVILAAIGKNPFGGGWNYVGMVSSIVLIVLAHKKFKDSGDGFMTYGQGVGIGFWFTLVSSALTLLVMYVYISFVDYGPMQLMLEENANKMIEQGQPEEQVQVATEWTRKLFWAVGAFMSIFFGMLIVLIVSIFTQKKNPQGEFN